MTDEFLSACQQINISVSSGIDYTAYGRAVPAAPAALAVGTAHTDAADPANQPVFAASVGPTALVESMGVP